MTILEVRRGEWFVTVRLGLYGLGMSSIRNMPMISGREIRDWDIALIFLWIYVQQNRRGNHVFPPRVG